MPAESVWLGKWPPHTKHHQHVTCLLHILVNWPFYLKHQLYKKDLKHKPDCNKKDWIVNWAFLWTSFSGLSFLEVYLSAVTWIYLNFRQICGWLFSTLVWKTEMIKQSSLSVYKKYFEVILKPSEDTSDHSWSRGRG